MIAIGVAVRVEVDTRDIPFLGRTSRDTLLRVSHNTAFMTLKEEMRAVVKIWFCPFLLQITVKLFPRACEDEIGVFIWLGFGCFTLSGCTLYATRCRQHRPVVVVP